MTENLTIALDRQTGLSGASPSRIKGVDAIRTVAIFAVVCIHARPFNAPGYETLGSIINVLCRFAVPFFFVASGFFFGRSLLKHPEQVWGIWRKSISRLFLIFVAWCVIYSAVPDSGMIWRNGIVRSMYWKLVSSINLSCHDPLKAVLEGTNVILWFIMALMVCMSLLAVFVRFRSQRMILPFACALYVLGVLAGAYSSFACGITLPLGINSRNGPFFGLLPFSLGWYFAGKPVPRPQTALAVLFIGIAVYVIESALIWRIQDRQVLYDYVFSTAFLGLGIFLIGLVLPQSKLIDRLAGPGQLTLGVYLIHMMLIMEFNWLKDSLDPVMYGLLFPPAVYAVSLAAAAVLSRNRLSRRLIQ